MSAEFLLESFFYLKSSASKEGRWLGQVVAQLGLQKISVFDVDDMRVAVKRTVDGSNAERADISDLKVLLNA